MCSKKKVWGVGGGKDCAFKTRGAKGLVLRRKAMVYCMYTREQPTGHARKEEMRPFFVTFFGVRAGNCFCSTEFLTKNVIFFSFEERILCVKKKEMLLFLLNWPPFSPFLDFNVFFLVPVIVGGYKLFTYFATKFLFVVIQLTFSFSTAGKKEMKVSCCVGTYP